MKFLIEFQMFNVLLQAFLIHSSVQVISGFKSNTKISTILSNRGNIVRPKSSLTSVYQSSIDTDGALDINKNEIVSEKESPEGLKDKRRQQMKTYYESNKDKIREQQKIHKESHKDEVTEYQKKYREANKGGMIEYQKVYREVNKDELKEYQKVYNVANKGKLTEERKAHYKANKSNIKLQKKAYYELNKHIIKEKMKVQTNTYACVHIHVYIIRYIYTHPCVHVHTSTHTYRCSYA